MKAGKLKIKGTRDGRGPLRGQELSISIEVDGEEVRFPARNLTINIKCDGRKEYVTATMEVDIHELDIEDIAVLGLTTGGSG